MANPVNIALVGIGWWGQKMLAVLEAAPDDIEVARAVEPNLDSVSALCEAKDIPLSADYADALAIQPSRQSFSRRRIRCTPARSRRLSRRVSTFSAKSRWR
jgi:hypothetical protein